MKACNAKQREFVPRARPSGMRKKSFPKKHTGSCTGDSLTSRRRRSHSLLARLLGDGMLDPREMRRTLITGLEMAAHRAEMGEYRTGVMRM